MVTPTFCVRRGTGRRTAGNRWVWNPLRKRAFESDSRPGGLRCPSASLATSLLHSKDGRGSPLLSQIQKRGRTDTLRARRPVRRRAATNACVRSMPASHRRQAIPNRLSFCRQETGPFLKLSKRFFATLRLCVFSGGWAALRLRGSAPLRFLCDVLVSRCLGGSKRVGGRLRAFSVRSVPLWLS